MREQALESKIIKPFHHPALEKRRGEVTTPKADVVNEYNETGQGEQKQRLTQNLLPSQPGSKQVHDSFVNQRLDDIVENHTQTVTQKNQRAGYFVRFNVRPKIVENSSEIYFHGGAGWIRTSGGV